MTEHEELLMLRALVNKQKNELAEKDAVIDRQKIQIEKQKLQIENMIQALLHSRKKIFGASTEAAFKDQLSLFSDTAALAKEILTTEKQITVPAHKKTVRQPGVRAEMLASLPTEIEEYVINPQEVCSVCGSRLKEVGKKLVRTEVKFLPARLKVIHVVQQVMKCTVCGTGKNDHPKDHFQKAKVPASILAHSIAPPSLVAQIMYEKFQMGIPLSRQEKDWYRSGLVLPRSSMSNWIIRCSEEWLTPVYNRIHDSLLKCSCLHMDETRIQCNKEEGRKASSNSFMWVMRSGAAESITATYFYYSPSRSGEIAKNLLAGYHGYLTTDAYVGYEKAEDIKRNLCWSHVRRKFIESIPLDNKGKEIPGSKGAEGRAFIDLLFKAEEEMKDLSAEKRKLKRQEVSVPILEAFWSWVEKTAGIHTTNENLTKALNYACNQRKYLETFLKDGRLPISNNLCEANIKPFATARRAWLFADTPKGAKANAILYTIVESAKANHLDVYEYIKYLLTIMPEINFYQDPAVLDDYLPWSKTLPAECHLKIQVKKNLDGYN